MSTRDLILSRVKSIALGNTRRGFKHVASDLLNELGKDQVKNIALGTFLCAATVERVMDCPEKYRPQSETLERIFKYCNAEVTFNEVAIKAKYQNVPKDDDAVEDEV